MFHGDGSLLLCGVFMIAPKALRVSVPVADLFRCVFLCSSAVFFMIAPKALCVSVPLWRICSGFFTLPDTLFG